MILIYQKIRSGNVSISNGRLRGSGISGYGWSTRTNSSDLRNAYNLGFLASGIDPSSNNGRWNGFPLRCLARQ